MVALLIALLIPQGISPPQAAEILEKLNQKFEEVPRYEVSFTHTLFKLDNMEPVDTATSWVYREGHRMHQIVGPVETVVAQDYILGIHHEMKTALLADNKDDYVGSFSFMKEYTEGILNLCSSIELEEEAGRAKLIIEIPYYRYEKITITYDPENYELIEMEMVLREDHPMIGFEGKGLFRIMVDMDKQVKPRNDVFQLERYVNINQEGKYAGTGLLKGYEVINQLEN